MSTAVAGPATTTWPGPLQWVERWFTASEPAAAGRMGLFRILFGLFYLWHLSLFDISLVAGLPADYRSSPGNSCRSHPLRMSTSGM